MTMNNDNTAPFDNPNEFPTEALERARQLLDEPPQSIGPYRIIERLGAGGMGEVYRADQKEPIRRQVAIKLIKLGMDTRQVIARFEAERQALAMMDHPNIAKVFDGGTTSDGRPYFVMEYVKGVPLTDYCDSAKLPLRDRLQLFIPVCQAVQHAHQKGIVHRDLKPSNILVCLYDGRPVPKVIDFGLAKALHQPLTEQTIYTKHGVMVGTPLYMSPEQAEQNNLDIDTRTDIYSLGVVLYELLTGSTPLEREQLRAAAYNEVLRLIKEVDPPKPSTRLSGSTSLPSVAAQRGLEPRQLSRAIAGDLDWIVMKTLEKERSRRYETATGLARDVERFLADEAVEACPPSTAYRLKKLINKHRGKVVAASLLISALIVGLIGTTWGFYRAKIAEIAANQSEEKAIMALADATKERDAKEEQRRLAEEAKLAESKQREESEQQRVELERQAYRLGLQTAYNSLEAGELDTANATLKTLPEHLRGWEWRWLMAESEPWLGRVNIPSNKKVLAQTQSGNYALLYDESDSSTPLLLMRALDGVVTHQITLPAIEQILAASMSAEGNKIAILAANSSNDNLEAKDKISSIYLWDKSSGEIEWSCTRGLKRDGCYLSSLGFDLSDSGKSLLVSTSDFVNLNFANSSGYPNVLNLSEKEPQFVPLPCSCERLNENGTIAFETSSVCKIEFVDGSLIANNFDVKTTLGLHDSDTIFVDACGDGSKLCVRSKDQVYLLDTENKLLQYSFKTNSQGRLAFHRGGERFVSISNDILTSHIANQRMGSFVHGRAPNRIDYLGVDEIGKSIFIYSGESILRYGLVSDAQIKRSTDNELGTSIATNPVGKESLIIINSISALGKPFESLRMTHSAGDAIREPISTKLMGICDRNTSADDATNGNIYRYNRSFHSVDVYHRDEDEWRLDKCIAISGFDLQSAYKAIVSRSGKTIVLLDWDGMTEKSRLVAFNLSTGQYIADMWFSSLQTQPFHCDESSVWFVHKNEIATLDLKSVSKDLKLVEVRADVAKISTSGSRLAIACNERVEIRSFPSMELLKSWRLSQDRNDLIGWEFNDTRLIVGNERLFTLCDVETGESLLSVTHTTPNYIFPPRVYLASNSDFIRVDGQVFSSKTMRERWQTLLDVDALEGNPKTTLTMTNYLAGLGKDIDSIPKYVREDSSLSILQKLRALQLYSEVKDGFREIDDDSVLTQEEMKSRTSAWAEKSGRSSLLPVFSSLIDKWKPDANKLNGAAWDIVKSKDSPDSELTRALQFAIAAATEEPDEAAIANTLGVAYFRVGEYSKCIESLQKSDSLLDEGKQYPSSQIFIAMATSKLGDMAKAKSILDEVIKQAESKPLGVDDAGFLNEAKEVLGLAEKTTEDK